MFQVTKIDLKKQESKSEPKAEAKFPTTKAANFTDEMVLKYAKKNDIEAIKEVLIRIMFSKGFKKLSSGEIKSYLGILQHVDNNDAKLAYFCGQIHVFIENGDSSSASELRDAAKEKFKENDLFLELIDKVYANALYKRALTFNSSLNSNYRKADSEQTKEATATLLAAITANNHADAWNKFKEINSIDKIYSFSSHETMEREREEAKQRFKLNQHYKDLDPRNSLIAIMYFIADKELGNKMDSKSREIFTKFLEDKKITTTKPAKAEDYLKGSIDPFVVFNFSKYCYNQKFIKAELYIEILKIVSEASKAMMIPALEDKFSYEQIRVFVDKVNVLVEADKAKELVELIDAKYGTDGLYEFLTTISPENDWNDFIRNKEIYKLYTSHKKDFLNQWDDDAKPFEESGCLKAAIRTIKTFLPEVSSNVSSSFFANSELDRIGKEIESKKSSNEKKLDAIQEICKSWMPKGKDQNTQKEDILKIITEAKDYLRELKVNSESKLEA